MGAMTLAGMTIKNVGVLLDQVNIKLAEGMDSYEAIMEAAVSRLRPMVLAAATRTDRQICQPNGFLKAELGPGVEQAARLPNLTTVHTR